MTLQCTAGDNGLPDIFKRSTLLRQPASAAALNLNLIIVFLRNLYDDGQNIRA